MMISGMSTRSSIPAAPASLHGDGLRRALAAANLPTLLVTLAHLTGDRKWIEDPYVPSPAVGVDPNDSGGFSAEMQERIRGEAFAVLNELDLEAAATRALSPERATEMLSVAIGEPVPVDYGELLLEELGQISRAVEVPAAAPDRDFRVLIMGGGISGLCTAITLERAGVNYVLVEKNQHIGGTWEENTYPGCACDTPVHLYSYSFAQHGSWTRYFARRDELSAYWRAVAAETGVIDRCRFGTTVISAEFDEPTSRWQITIEDASGGTDVITANIFVSAVGLLNRPHVPELPRLDRFAGPAVHTADWSDEVDVCEKNVVVIGTGASSMQLVPAIADAAKRVTVFQRSPQWAVPHPHYLEDTPSEVRQLMTHVPFYVQWYRLRQFWLFGDRLFGLLQIDPEWPHPERSINKANDSFRRWLTKYIESELEGRPDLLQKSLPTYPPYGKRMLLDNQWFKTIRRDDVDLVSEGVREVREHSVVSESGDEYPADVVVLATGFKALDPLGHVTIRGRGGELLSDAWQDDDMRAYLGMSVPNFPNFFCIYGPNTTAGHGGTITGTSELQVRYIVELIACMVERGFDAVDCRQNVFEAYNASLDNALSRTIWTHQGMTTYYRNRRGRIVANSPWKHVDYWKLTRHPNPEDYEFSRAEDAALVAEQ
jgi:4-hydroxyacetophenone monooxygenase